MVISRLRNTIDFWSTSFIRGTTFDRLQLLLLMNFRTLNFHELDSMITRIGDKILKLCFCGDATQTDLVKTK